MAERGRPKGKTDAGNRMSPVVRYVLEIYRTGKWDGGNLAALVLAGAKTVPGFPAEIEVPGSEGGEGDK